MKGRLMRFRMGEDFAIRQVLYCTTRHPPILMGAMLLNNLIHKSRKQNNFINLRSKRQGTRVRLD